MLRITTSTAVLALAWTVAGCDDGEIGNGPTETLPVADVEGAPIAAEPVQRADLELSRAPIGVAAATDGVAVATDGGVILARRTSDDLVDLPLIEDDGSFASPGMVRAIVARQAGFFALADAGLLHDYEGALLHSPLGAFVDGDTLLAADVLQRADGTEELWLVTDQRALIAGDDLVEVDVSGLGTIERFLGTGTDVAVGVADGTLFELDLETEALSIVDDAVGASHAARRAENGDVFVATDTGLYRRAADGAWSRFTFAAEGAPPERVTAVEAAFGVTVFSTPTSVALLDGDAATTIAEGGADALAVDAIGDTWAVSEGKLTRLVTGKPATFANDVAPMLADRCVGCHEDGTAPPIDFASYDDVVARADTIIKRVTRPTSPMPPPPADPLSPDEYGALLRWRANNFPE
ncbi:MAG: hypothetical protein HOW73_38645 [Polyangiaceae bacterium]|nr:hypothetical protein [Polyangiaceae bacterium]